jgi:MYXO-CTERM domain-containing protein
VPKIDNGKACQSANQCTSSFCVDGVCCDSPCTGQCESCAETGSVGQCKPRAGAPKAPKAACAGTGACVGQCDGANPNACVLPGASTQCSASSCTGDSLTPPGTCDSSGGCSVGVPKSCAPYACSDGACKSTCASDGDCAAGAICDTNKGLCAVSGATCTDAFTVKLPNGQTQSCSPYKCVGGACQQQCVDGNDCAAGYDCVASSCVPKDGGAGGSGGGSAGSAGSGGATADAGPDAGGATSGGEGSDEGGCGCRVAGATPVRVGPAWLSGLVVVALGLRRRRGRPRI